MKYFRYHLFPDKPFSSFFILAIPYFFSILLFSSDGAASEQTGTLKGTVKDQTGAPLQGIIVTIESPSLMGSKTFITEKDGSFRFFQLPPGTYTMRCEGEGFKTIIVQDLIVNIGRTTTVPVVMEVPTAEEFIEVIEERPTIDAEQTQKGEVLSEEMLERIPTTRNYQSTAFFLPGVLNTGYASGNPSVYGSSPYENTYLLDGIVISDPVTNTFSLNFNYDAMKEVEVLTGAYDPEYGQAMGGILNIVTKSGGNSFSSDSSIYYEDSFFSPKRDAVYDVDGTVIEPSEYWRQEKSASVNLSGGGPIFKDRLWYYYSYQYARNISSDIGVIAPRDYEGHYLLGKLTYQPDPAHQLQLLFHTDPTVIDNTQQDRYVLPEAESQQRQGGWLASLSHNYFITPNLFLKSQFFHQFSYIDVIPMPCTDDPDSPNKQCKEGQPDGYIDYYTPGTRGLYGAYSRDNFRYFVFDHRYRDSITTKLTYYVDDLLGSHEFKTGGEFVYIYHDYIYGYTGNMYYYDRLSDSSDATSTINYYWVERAGPIQARTEGFITALFIQDKWKPISRLTLRYGVRFDKTSYENDVGEKILDLYMFSPRAFFSFDPFGDGKTAIRGGYGRFADTGRLSISEFINKYEVGYKLFLGEYFGEDSNYAYDLYRMYSGQTTYSSAENLTCPRVDEISLGFEREIIMDLSAGATFTGRRATYLFEDDEINLIWNEDGTNIIGYRFGDTYYYYRLRTPYIARREYLGLELTLRKRFSNNFQVLASYIYSKATGLTDTAITEALDNPTQFQYEYGGILPWDRPHVFKFQGSANLPLRFFLGLRVSYYSGAPYEVLYWSDYFYGYYLRRALKNSEYRMEGYWIVDIKAGKVIRLPIGDVEAILDIFNLFNDRTITSYDWASLYEYGEYRPSSRVSPLSVQFGLRYKF